MKDILSSLPADYVEFFESLDDDTGIGELVFLYSRESILERNETHEVEIYLPGHVTIGNDSGDYEFILKKNSDSKVYWCDAGSMREEDLELVHEDFREWVSEGCPLPEEENENTIPLIGDIWIVQQPPGGLKELFEIKKLLGQSWGASEMKSWLGEEFPRRIIESGRPFAVSRICESEISILNLLGYSDKDSTNVFLYNK